jgi:hypothetical protein
MSATKAALLLEHHLKALKLPTILREYAGQTPGVREGAGGLSGLPAAAGGAGVAGPGAPRGGPSASAPRGSRW